MIQLIVGFIVLCLAFYVLKKCFSIIKYFLAIIFGLGFFILCGVQAGASYTIERVLNALRINKIMFYLLCILTTLASVYIGFWGGVGYFDSLTFSLRWF